MQQQYMLCLQQQQLQQQQMRHQSTHSPTSQPYPAPVSPLYSPAHQRSLNRNHPLTKPPIPNLVHQHISSTTGSPTHNSLTSSHQHQSPFTQQQQSPLSPPVPQAHVSICDEPSNQVSSRSFSVHALSLAPGCLCPSRRIDVVVAL